MNMYAKINSTRQTERVLVLLSTFNGEQYIKEQCNSIFSQNNVDIFLMIRDDGSTDSTKEQIKSLKNHTNISLIEGENTGAYNSFLCLIKEAPLEFKYYAFSDQDDVWLPEKLEKAVESLRNTDPERPALYYCGQKVTDAELNIIYEHKMNVKRSVYSNFIFNQMAGCTAVFNRRLMMALKDHIPNQAFAHDAWTYRLCVALNGQIIVDEETFLYYRQHRKNVVGLKNSLFSKIKRAYHYIYKYRPSEYAKEIIKFYSDEISNEKLDFLKTIERANYSKISRRKLIKNYSIDFHNSYLNILFRMKAYMKRI